MKTANKEMTVRNMENIPTYRVEQLGYKYNGLSEETKWELVGVQNKLEEAKRVMNELDGFAQVVLCTSHGREVVSKNFSKIDTRF